jgi:chromosome partitioning protein
MTDELFVVTIASEKGGVGKTTIATNLAVYLKALQEDLPVTIASFDNHFSVDNMFAIGGTQGKSVAGLFEGIPAAELAQLGEYGVQFLASERSLTPPDDDPRSLCGRLATSGLSGVLVLDTRPILDYFTRNALLAADLVLVPVKDRASLVNAASLRQVLAEGGAGQEERLWLVPSLVDGRLRLSNGSGMHQYLAFTGQERGFRMFDGFIAKSPKVEGLASGFSSRIHPVLTHARGTLVHGQLKNLADFVLAYRTQKKPNVRIPEAGTAQDDIPAGRRRRLLADCPVCGEYADGHAGALFFDLRSRRRGFLHPDCLRRLLAGSELQLLLGDQGTLALQVAGRGLEGGLTDIHLTLFDAEGQKQVSEKLPDVASHDLDTFLRQATGSEEEEWLAETLLVVMDRLPPRRLLAEEWRGRLAQLRRNVLQDLAGDGS